MNEFWLISAPGDPTCQQTWERMNQLTHKQHGVSDNYKFHIPDLKVGTLDVLVGLSDELGKLDIFCEQVTKKIAHYFGEVLEDQKEYLEERLLANGLELGTYLTRFQWDMAKYPTKQSLKNIADIIAKLVNQIDTDLKAKSSAYNSLKGNLMSLERKATGSLLTRNIGDLVKKTDFVLDSEYLTTLLVVVPKANFNIWNTKYEKLSDMVVPRSTKLLFEDNDHGLFTVTLFKKVVDEYKAHCRENRFIVRDFLYNEEELAAGKNELNKLATDKRKQLGPLVRWLRVNFSEAFTAWIHVKALRVFVESVLRYGLPVNFQAILVRPLKKSNKKLRDLLNQLYQHLDNSAYPTAGDAPALDIPGLGAINQTDYYPYVCYKINIDLSDHK